ncbi:MAG TPA: integrase [Deltaproteobacteria bacterium]|nr:integrase [Deltaproteobacteria bacterium]
MRLTDKACKNAKPASKPRKIADGHGLYLEIMPNGSKYWRLKYRFAGKEKRLALGVYPEVSLGEAREKREKARKLLASGSDPSSAKQEEKRRLLLNAENTFEAIAREWYAHHLEKWSDKHAQTILHRLETDLFPALGKRPLQEINPPELLNIVRKIEKRGAYELARRSVQYCGQIFRYAVVTGRADRNPAPELKGALKPVKKGHYAALDSKDLPEFLQKLSRNDARLFPLTRMAVELILLTFVRTGELIQAKWEEFDFAGKTWIIPAERMKMRQAHIVPLSRQVLSILEQIKLLSGNREWILPSQKNPRKHMSNNTILFALGRLGYKGQATGHGFRALAMSTIKEKLGYRHEVVDRQLAHAHRNSVDAAYDRAKFLEERRKMMQDWSNYIDKVKRGGEILKFPGNAVA